MRSQPFTESLCSSQNLRSAGSCPCGAGIRADFGQYVSLVDGDQVRPLGDEKQIAFNNDGDLADRLMGRS
jgi:hypothetical protein